MQAQQLQYCHPLASLWLIMQCYVMFDIQPLTGCALSQARQSSRCWIILTAKVESLH